MKQTTTKESEMQEIDQRQQEIRTELMDMGMNEIRFFGLRLVSRVPGQPNYFFVGPDDRNRRYTGDKAAQAIYEYELFDRL